MIIASGGPSGPPFLFCGMETLRSFYKQSHWFWAISRLLMVLLFVVSIVQIIAEGDTRGYAVPVNALCVVGALLLGILGVIELLRGTKPVWLRVPAGIFMLLFGVGLLALFFIGPVTGGLQGLLILIAVWFLLLGLRDLVMK